MSMLRAKPGLLPLAVLVVYLLTLLPLPMPLVYAKPFWLGLMMIWLALERPALGTLGFAFVIGLIADVLIGTLLGEHGFRLLVIVFIVRRFRPRLRFFPLWQQTLAVGALLLNDRIVILMLRSFASTSAPDWAYWLPALIGMLLWPLLIVLLDDLRQRFRAQKTG
jgi:rod shape-determining protein MreD